MSGTSADGVDAVLIEVDPGAFSHGRPYLRFHGHQAHPYPEALHQAVVAAASDKLRPSELCILQRRLGEHHAEAAQALLRRLGASADLASLHGQTVQHHPAEGATLQLADPYALACRLGCPVVWDLRRMDMALGGQGAPLVPLTELWLRGQVEPWAALNLGGIANITIWDGTRVQAWDVGPGMSLLDLAARRWLGIPYDPEGAYADGDVEEALLEGFLAHPHFQTLPPKSTGREIFGAAWLEQHGPTLEGLAVGARFATLAAFTAEAVAREVRRLPHRPARGLLSGGGMHHRRVRAELARRLADLPFEPDETFPSGAREAVSWALLGAASAAGVPGNLPEVTGATKSAVLGSVTTFHMN
jgi:anhydro-N-acetylmuramic acid kinase